MSTSIAKCPFCGAHPEITRLRLGHNPKSRRAVYNISCERCSVVLYGGTSRRDVIQRWNQRSEIKEGCE